MRATKRFEVFALAVVIALLATPLRARAQRSTFRSVSPTEAARMVAGQTGHVTIIFFYAAYCPHCRTVFPEFVELAEQYTKQGVSVLAFATDEDVSDTDAYVGTQHLPFARLHIEAGEKGQMSRAFTARGVTLGKEFGIPYFGVRDRDGQMVAEYTGTPGVAGLRRWLAKHVDG